MVISGAAWKQSRYQCWRKVYRRDRSTVGGGRIHRAARSRTPCTARLFCEADRARARDGRLRLGLRIRKPETFRGFAFLSLQHTVLIPFYTRANDTLP